MTESPGSPRPERGSFLLRLPPDRLERDWVTFSLTRRLCAIATHGGPAEVLAHVHPLWPLIDPRNDVVPSLLRGTVGYREAVTDVLNALAVESQVKLLALSAENLGPAPSTFSRTAAEHGQRIAGLAEQSDHRTPSVEVAGDLAEAILRGDRAYLLALGRELRTNRADASREEGSVSRSTLRALAVVATGAAAHHGGPSPANALELAELLAPAAAAPTRATPIGRLLRRVATARR